MDGSVRETTLEQVVKKAMVQNVPFIFLCGCVHKWLKGNGCMVRQCDRVGGLIRIEWYDQTLSFRPGVTELEVIELAEYTEAQPLADL